MTKNELIEQCKLDNPTMTAIINGEEMILSSQEYEKACIDWAEMKFAQLAKDSLDAKTATNKAILLAKLGITSDEAKLLLS